VTPPTAGRSRANWRLPGAPAPSVGQSRTADITLEPGAARIAVDLLGGDHAPDVVVDGALRALGADPDLHLLLVGPAVVADRLVGLLDPADQARVASRPTRYGVGMSDAPARASHPDTTVRAAVTAVAEGRADAVVSAGSTAATVTAAALGLGRLPGVRRPALAATLPAASGPVVLLDVGGSLEARPATLVRHAALGAAFAAVAHAIRRPRVGLLSVGTESGKGDRARRAADPVLSRYPQPAGGRYVGLVEGYELATGDHVDVVVTDGFTGNVLLKGIEAAYAMAGGPPAGGGTPRAASLLGVAGTVVVCHGAALADDIASGVALAAHLHRRAAASAISALLADHPGALPSEFEVTT
jgi:glycerol-3-phosphate acyltransferase PlsX